MGEMTREAYYEQFGARITQNSERLFVDEFLWPLLGTKIGYVIPQRPFIDATGKSRRIDFSYVEGKTKLAIEVNGETYHAEGIIPNEMFDDNLFRQNEILQDGYKLIRFSYGMLQSPQWRSLVMESLRSFITSHAPLLLGQDQLKPNPLQKEALDALEFYRGRGWKKGVIILPTGTGKTILSALDARRIGGKVLFLVHRLDILKQSITAYQRVWPQMRVGILTGEVRDNESECDVLFASKDTLRQPNELLSHPRSEFSYVVVDEVHHGQAPSYSDIFAHFTPNFMIGMTATPDRTDRKDIFELFDYNKIYEVSLQEAIEGGYLVPYTYYGLVDDIDYSRIRYQNNRYRVDDLERFLIIPKRNESILKEYLEKGNMDKAIGFCVSVKHANRMAEFFSEKGLSACAITSETADRDAKILAFRNNEINVAFTVDLFNEGVDFPNVRVLMFLRPTESKTVFMQQLGRGLRLCSGKDRVRVLDFIGNYKRANQVRKWLAKSSKENVVTAGGERHKKVVYTYSLGCEVKFEAIVEDILDSQDEAELEVTREDLKEAYFILAESLGHKPSRPEIDEQGQYKTALYSRLFGSWRGFLQDVGEYTEASYHYPQGVHIGHLLSTVDVFGRPDRSGTQFDDAYIRLRGNLGENRLGTYQRQVKYKLQAAMELGLLSDDRRLGSDEPYKPSLTALGKELRIGLRALMKSMDLEFTKDEEGIPSSRMALGDREYNRVVLDYISSNEEAKRLWQRTFLEMPAVSQMLSYLYQIVRNVSVSRAQIYSEFFNTPFVKQFCDQEGIEEATEEAARHRCPFLLNVLDSCGVISQDTQTIVVKKFIISPYTIRSYRREAMEEAQERAKRLLGAWPDKVDTLESADVSILRELFGAAFLTKGYHLHEVEYVPL